MIRRHRARGTMLAEVVFILPIIAAAFTVTYQLTSRVMRLERQTLAEFAGDARCADLIRRIGQDANYARSAVIERSDVATVLELQGCRPALPPEQEDRADNARAEATIRYQVVGDEIVRTVQNADTQSEPYKWLVGPGGIDFAIEAIDDKPSMVWISFIKRQQRAEGPELQRKLTTAVRIGQGGFQ